MSENTLRDLFDYDAWANRLYLQAVSELTDDELRRDRGTSHDSIFGTLVHIVGAWEVWLARWADQPFPALPDASEFADLAALSERFASAANEGQALLRSLSPDALDEGLEIRNLRGKVHVHTRREMFHHVVNHSTYHRGQLAALLRQAGSKPPTTDLIHFYRVRGG